MVNKLSKKEDLDKRPTIWLDITDFTQYAEGGNVTVSGIQRVIANLVAFAKLSTHNVRPVVLDRDPQVLYSADPELVDELVAKLQSGSANQADIIALEKKIQTSRESVEASPGDAFVMAGAFWIYQRYDLFLKLRADGVKICLFVHDLIQIKYPQYVSVDVNIQFRRSLLDVLSVVSLILTNSEYVKNEVIGFIHSRLGWDIPVQAVVLPTELPSIDLDADIDKRVRDVAQGEFVLCVATLEVRKNHIYLLKIWERLLRERGITVPNLVFVGKWGWRVEELQSHIDASKGLDRWLYILNDLSDAGLSYLYEHCLLTTYPSFAEGFGLPVGESLAHGKPCVASNKTSIPEVGRDFAQYFDPHNVESGFELFKAILSDRNEIEKWSKKIVNEFKPKTWMQYCTQFYTAVDSHALSSEPISRLGNNKYCENTLYYVGDDSLDFIDKKGERLLTARMTRAGGWHIVEDWGCWASERLATLRLQTALAAKDDVVIFMKVRAPDGENLPILSTDAGAGVIEHGPVPRHDIFVQFDGRTSADGLLEILVRSGGLPNGAIHGRNLHVGLMALGFARKSDLVGRIELLENVAAETSRKHSDRVRVHVERDVGGSSSAFMSRLLLDRGPLDTKSGSGFRRIWQRLWLKSAQQAARQLRWAAAEKRYAKLLRYRPDQPRLIVQYGHALKEQGAFLAAAGAYQFALSLDPANEEARRQWELTSERAKR